MYRFSLAVLLRACDGLVISSSGFMKEVIGMTWEAVVLTLGSLLIGALVMWFQNRSK